MRLADQAFGPQRFIGGHARGVFVRGSVEVAFVGLVGGKQTFQRDAVADVSNVRGDPRRARGVFNLDCCSKQFTQTSVAITAAYGVSAVMNRIGGVFVHMSYRRTAIGDAERHRLRRAADTRTPARNASHD